MNDKEQALIHFKTLIESPEARINTIKQDSKDFINQNHIVIGICPGDGIGQAFVMKPQKY